MKKIDLNSDMGEGFGAYSIGDDAGMLRIVTTVNVACGFHAGDPEIMFSTFRAAKEAGVAIGAHPGYPDLWGFGRRRIPYSTGEITRFIAYQIGAAAAVALLANHKITHVKVHGALGNLAEENAEIAEALVGAVTSVDRSLSLFVIGGSMLDQVASRHSLPIVREIYADRAYLDTGQLMPRKLPGSVIHDAELAGKRVLAMMQEGAVIAASGKRIPLQIASVCVHGDTPNAVSIASTVRCELEKAGFTVTPYTSV
jgi:UPF0271 protein